MTAEQSGGKVLMAPGTLFCSTFAEPARMITVGEWPV